MYAALSTQVASLVRKTRSALLMAPMLLLSGCATHTETGALTGAGIGAVGGAIVGSALHAPGLGAAIGAAGGAVTGAAIGNAQDKREARQQAQAAAATIQVQQQGMTDIAQMSKQKVPENIIINQIRTSPIVYALAPNQIEWLRQNGVSDVVITEMQATAMRLPQRVYVAGPVYQPAGVVVVEEPPPVAVGVGVGFHRRW